MSSIMLEEYELMKDQKYRVYVSAVDKALKNFEYTSEWADLISALGKLNKVLLGHMKFPVIPRRIKISKRLAQCMHPALPSGVHLKALETYDVIFKCMGTNRLSHELFIYSAGLFPLLGHAAMNVRPTLLTVYETHFVPLGERLRPGLSGFLSGVLLGLEEGSDHFDRTNCLLEKVCDGVGPAYFYTCLWDCLASNSGIRLPAILFVLSHFNKKLTMEDQLYIMGNNTDVMVSALYIGVQDSSVLVQRSVLDFLLIGFPLHNTPLPRESMVILLTAALTTILRRDMSLNRRLFAWLLGTEVNSSILKKKIDSEEAELIDTYFHEYSKNMLIEAIKSTMKSINNSTSVDLKPYRILVSLLDKPEIGPVILDDILYELFRTFYNMCSQSDKLVKSQEIIKSANLLFSTLEPAYVWIHCGQLFEKACIAKVNKPEVINDDSVKPVGSGMPNLIEVCILTEFLLETVSVDAFIDTPSEHLPEIFLQIINKLFERLHVFTPNEITKSLALCRKILSKVQPMVVPIQPDKNNKNEINNGITSNTVSATATNNIELTATSPVLNLPINDNSLTSTPLEKSQSDSKLNKQKLSSPVFNDRSPSPRRRANSGGTKKSDKKSKKKTSKSASKINELTQDNSNNSVNNISVIVSDTASNKSVDDSNIDYSETNSEYDTPRRLSLFPQHLFESPINSPNFNSRTPSPGNPAQKTLSEKCLRQYEQFYVKLISDKILGSDKTIYDMYKKLLILNPKKSSDEKLKLLETILNLRLNIDKPKWILSNSNVIESKDQMEEPFNLYIPSVDELKWDEVLKLASSLLVELSTFPTYFQSGDEVLIVEEPIEPVVLPNWLQVLVVCSCWLSKQPQLQLTSIATLLDLIALFRAHNDVSTQCKNEDGITTVIMEPLLKKCYISYLIEYTNVFQTISHFLWQHLGELPPHKYRLKCAELLYELNYSLYQHCDAVENTIGLSLINSNLEKKIEAFNRFATLWHLGREIETNPRLRGCTKTFDKSLLKMLDNLQLQDNSPLKLHAQSWLIHSLVRGDIARVVDPLLTMLLDPSTCRMSILHVSIQHSNTVLTKNDKTETKSEVKDDMETSAKIYAISSVDGNVIYHVSNSTPSDDKKSKKNNKFKKKQPINPVKVKRIFAVTTLANTDKGNQYITERNQFMKELEVPPSISGNYNISVFVNPMSVNCHPTVNDSSTEEDVIVDTKKNAIPFDLLKNASRFKKPTSGRDSTGSFDESLFESINSTYNKSNKDSNKVDFKKLSKDLTSSLDSITNSLESSSPEITTNKSQLKSSSSKKDKDKDKDKDKSELSNQIGGSREIAGGSMLKGKYVNNNEFSLAYEMHETSNNFDNNTGIPSWTMGGDEDCELDLSTTAEEYFSNSSISVVEEVLNEVVDKVLEICENDDDTNNNNNNTSNNNNSYNQRLMNNDALQLENNNNIKRNSGVGVHNLHSHMLLYCGVCDSSRILYALRTLKNELITNTRMYLFAAATTAITSANKNTILLTLLARHKKSVLGRNFYGDVISTKFIGSYRSSMYLEVLILVCLYLLRSYYPNLGQMRLTQEEIVGNQQVQLASAELLTLIFSELVSIVRDSGKGFSCYIIDLLAKCKVQKIALHCLASSVLNMKNAQKDSDDILTFTEEIVLFNDPPSENDLNKCKYRASDHTEVYQMQLLKLVSALIMLEYQCSIQKGDDLTSPPQTPSTPGQTLVNSIETTLEYTSGLPIPQQPLFINSILSALQLDHMRHLHQHWTTLVTSSLPYMGASLTQVVTSVIHQLCYNIEHLASYYVTEDSSTLVVNKLNDFNSIECCLPADYTVTHLEALTFLLQYCLLDNTQQISLSFNQPENFQSGIPGPNPGQIFNNLIHVFTPGLLSSDNLNKDKSNMSEQRLNAKRTTLSHLPRIIASLSTLWQAVLVIKDSEPANCVLGNPRVVKHQLLELLSPISFHHGVNFLTAVAVAWHERRNQTSSTSSKKILPEACPNQQVIVHLVSAIRVMPIDTLVQTVNQVIKTPPPIQGVKQDFSLEVSVLELLYVYMQTNLLQSLVESWGSLLGLMKDGLSLTAPAQFLLLAILNEYIQKCPPMQEKKDIRDLQDISAKLIESCSQIAGACLEQTTWLRRNLAVREDVIVDVSDVSSETTPGTPPNSAYSVQAQGLLAEILSPLLDVSYGSQEKERVVTILINVMYNITPYLKNHSSKNISSFIACSQLLSSLSSYQYTRKAWRKDVLDLLLDSAFFQMTPACLPYWRTIIDNLMTHDNTTFRDLINRLSMAQSSGISIFSSKEQEYEQRSQLLKRLAFVIFCSETDQYHKYMPDIQERLADSLRLPQVIPSIQAQVFLCFRVLLLRMSPQHATSLWPVIVSELVQVLLHIEQELNTDTEEFSRQNSSHLKLLSALDSSWAVNVNNGLQAHGNPHWLLLQLAAAKLLDLALLLPAHKLPQFQMYRWAFVGNSAVDKTDNNNLSSDFIPHITRIARLMDLKFPESLPIKTTPGELILKSNRIKSLQELHYFFTTLSYRSKNSDTPLNMTQLEADIEQDFLEPMLTVPTR